MKLLATLLLAALTIITTGSSPAPDWALNATVIEACSCTMFCPCYFNPHPSPANMSGGHSMAGDHAMGGGHSMAGHYCRFNNAFKINHGNYGGVKLDGAKFWVAGDLGGDFSKGQMDWAVVTFDKALSKEQRDGVAAILAQVYPVKWNSLTTAEANIDRWEFNQDTAQATMDGGRTAEVKLHRAAQSNNAQEPVVMKNLKYWGVPRNDGFVMMPNDVEAYRVGPKAFEYKGTNGFMITLDMNSKDVK